MNTRRNGSKFAAHTGPGTPGAAAGEDLLRSKRVRTGNRMMALMGVLGLLIFLFGVMITLSPPAKPADPTKDWVWKSDGKRWTRTEADPSPLVTPEKTTVDVPPNERREGDSWRMKYVGKTMERVYTREVERPAPKAGHECTWRMRYQGKRSFREYYCLVDGVERSYQEMHPPEIPAY